MALWVAVNGMTDGEAVNAEVFNRGLYQVVERTNYLYGKIQDMIGSSLLESIRVTSVTLVTSGTPAIGDFVYLEESSGKYAKAVASPSTVDVFSAANSAYSLGMLTAKAGNTGTVTITGKILLNTNGTGWDLSTLLETGEVFRNGPYYLSSTEPGKMTAEPHGPAIYLGYVMEDASKPGYGGFVMLSPQYKDMKESHVHRVYNLTAQPAGTQYINADQPSDTVHEVRGFNAKALGVDGDHIPRLVISGVWKGLLDTQYTFWLSQSPDPAEDITASVSPTNWGVCYIHWSSSNPAEDPGYAKVWSYESPVPMGSTGLYLSLENSSTTDWDEPYLVASPDLETRKWVVDVPTATKGWLACKYRQYFSDHPATDNKFSFVLIGGPHSSADARIWDNITIKCAHIYDLSYTDIPVDGKTVTVADTVFTFKTALSGADTDVLIASSAEQSFQNLVDTILANELANVTVAFDSDDSKVIIGVATDKSVATDVTGATASEVSGGLGNIATGTPAYPGLMVYDRYNNALIATTGFWSEVKYWIPQDLTNDLQIMAIPYDSDGTAAAANAIAIGDYWDAQVDDEAPGANFVLSIGMDQALYKHYPPIPLEAATLVRNGHEVASYHLFPSDPVYRLSLNNIYWYNNVYGQVPWPRDWQSVDDPGGFDEYDEKIALYFVRMGMGNTGVVTSLRPATGSPIKVLDCGTNEAGTVGDLALDIDLALSSEDVDLDGYQVVKSASGNKLRRGPVVEKITAGPGIQLSSTYRDGQGTVQITAGTSTYNGDFETVALENAKQEKIGMFPYIKLLGWSNTGSNINTGFVAKFRIPHTLGYDVAVPPKYRVVVYMTVFGETTVTSGTLYAGIDFEYSILPDFFPVSYNDGSTPESSYPAWNSLDATLPEGLMTMKPESVRHINIPFGSDGTPSYKSFDPILIHNNSDEPVAATSRKISQALGVPFPISTEILNWGTQPDSESVVKPGSIVGIRVHRADAVGMSPSEEYQGALGFINIRWKLVSIP